MVDTRRGTNASGSFSRGNNLPISAVPNGFTFLTPVTDSRSNSWEYYYQQANDADNHPTLQGFSVSHEPSPWMGDRNQLSVMPGTSATPSADPSTRALAFTHDDEIARPDYYRVNFLDGLTTELSPTDHGAIMRFTFPADSGSLLFDTVDRNGSFVIDPAAGTVHGWVDNGSGLSVGRSRMFFAGTFSAKPTSSGTAANGNPEAQYAAFGTKTVELRLATSFIGLAQAQHNEALELTGRSFDQVHAAATRAWQQRLGVLDVSGETDSQRETLYSNLYRLNLYPNSQFENAGTANKPDYEYASPTAAQTGTPSDTATNAAVKHGKVYVNNGFWDTYRTVWPAYSLLYPQVAADLVDGFVQQYRDGGWVARWSSPGYADLMTGTSSDVAFAGAYLRGVPEKDPLTTYEAGLKNATVLPTASGVGRKGLATSIFKKYTSTATGESVSWQLEGDINDAGLSQMAAQLAKDENLPAAKRTELRDEAKYFADRVRAVRQPVRQEHRLLPGPQARRIVEPGQGRLRPRVVGRRLHRDRRVELRLPRTAGRPGAGRPLRRTGRTGEQARHVLRHAGDGRQAGRLRRGHPRDDRSARGAHGPVRHEQPALAPHPVHVRLRPTAVQGAGAGAGGTAPALRGAGNRPGVSGRRGQRRDVGLVHPVLARLVPTAVRLAQLGDRQPAVPEGGRAPVDR